MSSIKIIVPSKIVRRIIYTVQLQAMAIQLFKITITSTSTTKFKNSSYFKSTSPEISLNINIKSSLILLVFKLSNPVVISLFS